MAKKNKLNIWMNGVYVGFWQRNLGVEELYYDQAWVDSEQGRPLSLSLPPVIFSR
jgi:serine/threonine-protein kinase HipA